MRLPSSSSLLLATLAISSSSSSLSALAAPTGECPEDSPSPAPIPPRGNDTMAQSNSHLQSRNTVDDIHSVVDKIVHDTFDLLKPILGESLKARDVSNLLPHLPSLPSPPVKARAEGAEPSGTDAAPEPTQPSSSAPLPSASPTAAAAPAAPTPPAKLPDTPSPPSVKPPVGLPAAPHGRRDSASGRGLTDGIFSPLLPGAPQNSPVA